jgi:hypothetical protein
MIYDYLHHMNDELYKSSILQTIPMDREETIKSFNEFKNKTDKTIY